MRPEDPGIPADTARFTRSTRRLLRRLRKHHPEREIPGDAPQTNGIANGHSAPMATPTGYSVPWCSFTLTSGPTWYGRPARDNEDLATRTRFARAELQAAVSYRGASTGRRRPQVRPRDPGTRATWQGTPGRPPPEVEADRQRRAALPLPLESVIFGDPIPGSGQSALEQRQHAQRRNTPGRGSSAGPRSGTRSFSSSAFPSRHAIASSLPWTTGSGHEASARDGGRDRI